MQEKKRDLLIHGLLIIVLAFMMFPFYWMIVSSLRTPGELFSPRPTLLLNRVSLQFYYHIFSKLRIGRYFFNSLYLSLLTSFITAFFGSLAAFSFMAYKYRGRILFSRIVLFIYMFPQILVVIPLYILLTRAKLINTHTGILITYLAFNLPVAIWVLKAYFSTIPYELMEAALVDGLSKIGVLFRIVIPLAAPGIVAAAIMAFIGAWNEFLFANVFLVDTPLKTLPVVIVDYHTQEAVRWGEILASSSLISIPSFLFATFIQRYLVSGLTAGAVKA